jgi:hypothetical protein
MHTEGTLLLFHSQQLAYGSDFSQDIHSTSVHIPPMRLRAELPRGTVSIDKHRLPTSLQRALGGNIGRATPALLREPVASVPGLVRAADAAVVVRSAVLDVHRPRVAVLAHVAARLLRRVDHRVAVCPPTVRRVRAVGVLPNRLCASRECTTRAWAAAGVRAHPENASKG